MKNLIVKKFQTTDAPAWDDYVHAHPQATLYHLSGWQNIINKTYGHKTYYLMAVNPILPKIQNSKFKTQNLGSSVVGILPLVHIKHLFLGNTLISIPFFDLGGILADNEKIEQMLLLEAIRLGQELKVNIIELRHITPLKWFGFSDFQKSIQDAKFKTTKFVLQTRLHKVRMLLNLPNSSGELMKSFKSKLRSQIRKPFKEGLKTKIGGLELLDDFYTVFSINMRDLGSPVHSKMLIEKVLKEFPDKARIVVVYNISQPVASCVIIGFKDTIENPWSGFNYFDFGRSFPGEGSYKFKEQWGAKPEQLYWHIISFKNLQETEEKSQKSKFEKAIQCWKKLPVPATKIIGPMIRKYIGL